MVYKIGTRVFDNWEIVRELGEGANGQVFELVKKDYGITIYSALKVIRVPRSMADIKAVFSEGMDEQSVSSYFQGFVDELVKEIIIMTTLKSHPNIVSYEDHQIIPHEGSIGWDILIRMELLTPLTDYQLEHKLSPDMVLRMGRELCSALVFCQNKGMIHRDIKPENIFVSETGLFKLGDFGVARTIEKTTGGLSRKGTEKYMAPEVYLGKPYGVSVDIYSLGLVLYSYVNRGRMPFYPMDKKAITFADRENALGRRMMGEPLPMPVDAGPEFAKVILTACAFEAKDRYSSAAQMLEALNHVSEMTGSTAGTVRGHVPSQSVPQEHENLRKEPAEERTVGMGYGNKPAEEQTVGMGYGKEPAEEQTVGMAYGKEPPEERTVGMAYGKKAVEEQTVGMVYGKEPPEEQTVGMAYGKEPIKEQTVNMADGNKVSEKEPKFHGERESRKERKKRRPVILAVAAAIFLVAAVCIVIGLSKKPGAGSMNRQAMSLEELMDNELLGWIQEGMDAYNQQPLRGTKSKNAFLYRDGRVEDTLNETRTIDIGRETAMSILENYGSDDLRTYYYTRVDGREYNYEPYYGYVEALGGNDYYNVKILMDETAPVWRTRYSTICKPLVLPYDSLVGADEIVVACDVENKGTENGQIHIFITLVMQEPEITRSKALATYNLTEEDMALAPEYEEILENYVNAANAANASGKNTFVEEYWITEDTHALVSYQQVNDYGTLEDTYFSAELGMFRLQQYISRYKSYIESGDSESVARKKAESDADYSMEYYGDVQSMNCGYKMVTDYMVGSECEPLGELPSDAVEMTYSQAYGNN